MEAPDDVAILVKDLYRRFGPVVALDGVSVEVRRGEVVSLLGPNGAGKTTLVRHLYCELRPQRGLVRVLGDDPCKVSVRRRVGVVPQEAEPYEDLTVFDNIYYAARLRGLGKARAREAAAEVVKLLGLEEHRSRYVMDLSGGLKRRVLIGMAIVHDPDVLVLDEPTTGLDPLARRETWDLLRQLKEEGKSVLLTTHYMEEAEALSDRVYFLNRKVIAHGSPAELRARFTYYYEVIDYSTGRTMRVPEGKVKEVVASLAGKFEVRIPSLEEIYLEVVGRDEGAGGAH